MNVSPLTAFPDKDAHWFPTGDARRNPAPWGMREVKLSSTKKSGFWEGWMLPAHPPMGTLGVKSLNSSLAFNMDPDCLIHQTSCDLQVSPGPTQSGGGASL